MLHQQPKRGLASTLTAVAVLALLVVAHAGCARTGATATEGEVISHPAGFVVVVPEGWTWTHHDRGLRLVGIERQGKGYPTIQIDAIPASELPDDFLDGRAFEWPQGKGSFHYRRWSNPLGRGDALTVHLMSETQSLVVEVERWSDELFMGRRFYRKRIWPILNSIEAE